MDAPERERSAAPQAQESALSFQCHEEVVARLSQLYGDTRHADVTFVVQRDEASLPQRFPAHRSLVAAWSQPLESMLCGAFAEGGAKEVRLLDVEPAAFEVLLRVIYTGTAQIGPETVLAVLDAAKRFDVAPLVQFSVQFLQKHATSEHACRMLEIGVQYGLSKLVDKCIELIVTDDHILESEDFNGLSQAAMIELAKHDAWNLHEDSIYDIFMRWATVNSQNEEEKRQLSEPLMEQLRYPHMSISKLKKMWKSPADTVPADLVVEALFVKLEEKAEEGHLPGTLDPRRRPRSGSLLFSWVPTSRVTVSGELRENARHTSSNGFTGVRGDRPMRHGCFSWTIDLAETQSSWIFVGVVQAEDASDVAWRGSGHMLYCLDSRFFHQGSGQNHPCGDRKVVSGDCIKVVLDCNQHTLAFGINQEEPIVLFRDMEPTWYVAAVDLRDCGDKVRILSCRAESKPSTARGAQALPREVQRSPGSDPARLDPLRPVEAAEVNLVDTHHEANDFRARMSLELHSAQVPRPVQPRQFGSQPSPVSTSRSSRGERMIPLSPGDRRAGAGEITRQSLLPPAAQDLASAE